MRLVELFDTSVDWDITSQDRHKTIYRTEVDGDEVKVVVAGDGTEDLQIDFYRNDSTIATGEGNAAKVFSVVINLLSDIVQDQRPVTVMFMAVKDAGSGSTSRNTLYRRMGQRYASQMGYRFESEMASGTEIFIFTRNDAE
jgi:hypothetical protein